MHNLKVDIFNPQGEVTETILIGKTPRKNLTSLIDLQTLLLEYFIACNGSVGSLVCDNASWKALEKISKLIPLVPHGTLYDRLPELENDYAFITKFFFTESWDDEEGRIPPTISSFKPSQLSRLNCLDYEKAMGKGGLLGTVTRQKQEMEMKMQVKDTVDSLIAEENTTPTN